MALATAMVFVGMLAAITSLKQSTADGFGDAARAFTIVPVSGLVFFVALFVFALVKVRQLETHKRLMVVATVSLLQAAVGRWFLIFIAPVAMGGGPVGPPPVFVTIMPGLLSDLLIVAAMMHDRKTRGHVHPVYWIAGGCVGSSPGSARAAQHHGGLDSVRALAVDGVVVRAEPAADSPDPTVH